MANRDTFFKAVFVEPPRICGKRLRPFSLAHEYFLEHTGNSALCRGAIDADSLLTAIFVCSLTYSELKRHINSPRMFRLGLWYLKWRFRNLDIAAESFLSYVDEYIDVPDHWSEDREDSYSAPWQWHMVTVLCDRFNCTLNEAWDTPVSFARCAYDTFNESKGDKSIVSDHQELCIAAANAAARGEIAV